MYGTLITANGNYPSDDGDYMPGAFNVHVDGTWDGASIALQSNGDVGWKTIATFTDNVDKLIEYQRPVKVRLVITNAGASTSLNWEIR